MFGAYPYAVVPFASLLLASGGRAEERRSFVRPRRPRRQPRLVSLEGKPLPIPSPLGQPLIRIPDLEPLVPAVTTKSDAPIQARGLLRDQAPPPTLMRLPPVWPNIEPQPLPPLPEKIIQPVGVSLNIGLQIKIELSIEISVHVGMSLAVDIPEPKAAVRMKVSGISYEEDAEDILSVLKESVWKRPRNT